MIEQVAIGILGISSVWLSQERELRLRRYACLCGLTAQPFWFYATYKANQYGMMFLCIVYTIAWSRGIYNNWIKAVQ